METIRDLTKEFHPEMVIIESGGDNLAANYSRELADYIIYVIDVAGKSTQQDYYFTEYPPCRVATMYHPV